MCRFNIADKQFPDNQFLTCNNTQTLQSATPRSPISRGVLKTSSIRTIQSMIIGISVIRGISLLYYCNCTLLVTTDPLKTCSTTTGIICNTHTIGTGRRAGHCNEINRRYHYHIGTLMYSMYYKPMLHYKLTRFSSYMARVVQWMYYKPASIGNYFFINMYNNCYSS